MRATIFVDHIVKFSLNLIDVTLTFSLHQYFDARFVQVVASAPAVVDAHHGFEVVHDLLPRQELPHQGANDGGSAHATADPNLEANFARNIFDKLQADIVPTNGGAVFFGACDGNFEFAGQECKLRVQGAPLAQYFCVGPRVDHLVYGHTRQFVGGDVANAVAAGLNAVHVDGGQQVHHVGRLAQWNPVELNVLPGCEVAVAFDQLG